MRGSIVLPRLPGRCSGVASHPESPAGRECHEVVARRPVGVASFALVAGRRRLFAGLVGSAVVATGFFFNPLARGLHSLQDLDLTRHIAWWSRQMPGSPPLWVCYGPLYSGVVVSAFGGKT